MLPADQDIPVSFVFFDSLLHTLGVVAIARSIHSKTQVLSQGKNRLIGTGPLAACSSLLANMNTSGTTRRLISNILFLGVCAII